MEPAGRVIIVIVTEREKKRKEQSEENEGVNTVPPIQQNPTYNGYDENKGYGESYENECDELQHHKQQQVEREHAQQQAAHHAQQVHQ